VNQEPSKKDRRHAAREAARAAREAELKAQKRKRRTTIAIVTVVAVLALAGIGYAIFATVRANQQDRAAVVTPPGIAEGTPYLAVGEGETVVDLYVDFMCPFCGQFAAGNSEQIAQMATNDDITLHYYPRSMLDPMSTSQDYSSRSAAASTAVWAESPEMFLEYEQLLFQNQPAEGSAGLSDAELVALAEAVGASAETTAAIEAHTYVPWIQQVVEPHASSATQGTPSLWIDGEEFAGDLYAPGVAAQAIADAAGVVSPRAPAEPTAAPTAG
jgi:protein-disulfide isomerase